MLVPFAIIFYCGLDGVLGKDRTVDLDWGEGKMLCNC
jgi:hypothetical protein